MINFGPKLYDFEHFNFSSIFFWGGGGYPPYTMKAIDRFTYNSRTLNADKCHLLLCGHKYELMIGNVDNNFIIESHKVKFLGIEI